MGQLNNTIVVFTTDNGAETITFPDGGTTPFKGGKLSTWEGGMRAPLLVRWPDVIRPGTIKNEMFAALDWLPTLVNIAGGDRGDALNKRINTGNYPGITKTKLDGFDQTEYLAGRSEKSARDASSTTQARTHRRFATRTGRSTSRWCPTTRRALLRACCPFPGPRSSISSVIPSRPRSVLNTRRSSVWVAQSALPPPHTSTIGTCCQSARRCG